MKTSNSFVSTSGRPGRVSLAVCWVTLALLVLARVVLGQGVGTGFTYQGRLFVSGNPATGLFDLRFTLFGSSNSTSIVAGPVTNAAVGVTNGQFTVLIDFGPGVFAGADQWLELAARTSNTTNAFTVLSPRQELTPVPYALYSESAGTVGTTADTPVELYAFNHRGLELSYAGRSSFVESYNSMNVVGGFAGNTVGAGVVGATIAGGGETGFNHLLGTFNYPNIVSSDFGTVSGGVGNSALGYASVVSGGTFNTAAGYAATVPGGINNRALGNYSFAAGENAVATNAGSFVFADSQGGDFVGMGTNEVAIRADNGMYMQTQRGVRLDAQNAPLITRGFDLFAVTNTTIYGKAYCGRWGLFMEPGSLVVGIPNTDVSGGYRRMEVARYNPDGSRDTLLQVGNDEVTTVKILTITGGADVAEPFVLAEPEVPSGSVVVIDDTEPGRLQLSRQPYDTRVAGIVSGANGIHPGLSLRQEGVNDQGHNVALTGRVYALADAENGAIHPGDLLTTSARPGHAMRVTDYSRAQGAILGKAMSRLDQGTGLVLVLVTLQ